MKDKKLKLLYVSAEIAPFAATGGLGDVAESLPEELAKSGLHVVRVMPKYQGLEEKYNLKKLFSCIIEASGKAHLADIYAYEEEQLTTYFIGNEEYFNRDSYYGYDDDGIRFGFFSKAVLEMLMQLGFQPDIVHGNDWHTGLLSFLLKEAYAHISFYAQMKVVYTIHNLQYQGKFGWDILEKLNISKNYFHREALEYYGMVSFMKAGIIFSDLITTVSDTYAKEIQTAQYGYGMEGVLCQYHYKVCGIINGIHYDKFDPETDQYIHAHYTIDNVHSVKIENKQFLQQEVGLPLENVPLIGMVSRLSGQKGIDLCVHAIEKLVDRELQFVILGTGEHHLEQALTNLAEKYPDKVKVLIAFNQRMARLIYSGSDFFLMPSLFEPCGLSQIYSMRFGTVPIVRKTGGLVDTVIPFNEDTREGTGFVFASYNGDELVRSIGEGLDVYSKKDKWAVLINNCMAQRFSWDVSAKKYIKKYNELLQFNDM